MKKNLGKFLALACILGTVSAGVACNQTPPEKTYFDVTINGNVESVEKNGLLTEPAPLSDYESQGYLYVFEGWTYKDANGETKLWIFDVDKVISNVTLIPKFTRTEIPLSVTFKNGDTVVSTVTVNKSDGKLTAPTTIEQTYDDVDTNRRYTLEYWYVIENNVEKRWNFNVSKVTKDGTILYAKYSYVPLTVAVTINGEVVNVPYGETIDRPEVDPVKEPDLEYTYTFTNWMCNGSLFDFSTPITEPITLTPHFRKTERRYNISINLDNGTVINRENILYGENLSDYVPLKIEKESSISTVYTFSHFEDVNGETVTKVNGSATYIAIYTESVRKYAVTTNIDGKIKEENVDYGSNLLSVLGAPAKAEDDDAIYTFSHWEDADGETVGAEAVVEGEGTYICIYNVEYKRYKITFNYAGKNVSQKINVGENLIDYLPTDTNKPSDPTLGEIYTFSHWEDSKGNTVNEDTVVSSEETYTAIYDVKEYNGTMSISDVVVATKESGRYIPVIFSKKGFSAPVTYSFEGNDISISKDGYITVNNVGKEVVVTAKNEENQMEDTFTVKTYDTVKDYVSTNFSTDRSGTDFSGSYTTHKEDIAVKLDENTPSIVFMGDSFFDAGRYNNPGNFWSNFYTKDFLGMNAYSFGVSGARSDEVTAWVSAVAQYAPKSLVIHVGTNDIYDLNKDGTKTAQDIVDMLATVHNALPNTHVYYISVEYRSSKKAGNAYEDISNAAAKAYCDNTNNVTYLDSLPYFTTKGVSSGGEIDTNKFKDGIHIKPEYYSVYIDLLKEAGVNFDDYVVKVKDPIQKVCGVGSVTLDGDTLTIDNVNGSDNRTRAYLFDTENQKFIQGDVAVWGTLNMKDIVVANNQFAEILLMEKPDGSWATKDNYNIIDLIIRKHAGQSVVKPVIWGYGIGGETAYKWDDNDYTIEFSLVVKDKKAYVTLDGATRTLELKSDALYIGFGSENLKCTFTGLTVSTDEDVIMSKIPDNVPINDVEDYTTSETSKIEANKKVIYVGTEPLCGEFVIEGTLEFLQNTTSNPHVEFKLNNSNNNRFLLWDNEKNGNFRVSAIMAGKTTRDDADANDILVFEKNKTLTWKVVVYNGDYYFYINNELRLVNKGGADVTSFNISSENVSVKFSGMKVYMKSNDPNGFSAQIDKIQADITENASLATGVTRV